METDELHTPLHDHAALAQSPPEHLLDVGLPYERQMREGGVAKVDVAESRLDDAATDVDERPRCSIRTVEEVGGDTQRTEAFERSSVQHHRACPPEAFDAAIDDPHTGAMGVRLECGRQTRRARSDDQNVRVGDHGAATRRHQDCPDPATSVECMRLGSASTSSRCSPGRT